MTMVMGYACEQNINSKHGKNTQYVIMCAPQHPNDCYRSFNKLHEPLNDEKNITE